MFHQRCHLRLNPLDFSVLVGLIVWQLGVLVEVIDSGFEVVVPSLLLFREVGDGWVGLEQKVYGPGCDIRMLVGKKHHHGAQCGRKTSLLGDALGDGEGWVLFKDQAVGPHGVGDWSGNNEHWGVGLGLLWDCDGG